MAGTGSYVRAAHGFQKAISDQRAFAFDTTLLEPTDNVNILLENNTVANQQPKSFTVVKVAAFADFTDSNELLLNPDTDTPSTNNGADPVNLNGGDSPGTDMDWLVEDMANPMSGSDFDTNPEMIVDAEYSSREYAYVLRPGDSIGVNVPSGVVTSPQVKLSIFGYEEDV